MRGFSNKFIKKHGIILIEKITKPVFRDICKLSTTTLTKLNKTNMYQWIFDCSQQ